MLIPRSRQNPFKSSVHRDQFPVTYQPCTGILVKLKNILACIAKTRAIPFLYAVALAKAYLATGTISRLKNQDRLPDGFVG
jgi:hypothetical protein